MTRNTGHVRFNPNLYGIGEIGLSLLGTWRGQFIETGTRKYLLVESSSFYSIYIYE